MLKNKGPVRYLDRSKKARRIDALLKNIGHINASGLTILDVGCGNGQIASYFAEKNECVGVDVDCHLDDTSSDRPFLFRLVESEWLPFEEESFDVVVSHHVIEHVTDQNLHLSEIKRVLKPGGICYLACPNKGSPFMKGHVGNDMVPDHLQFDALIAASGMLGIECYSEILMYPEDYYLDTKFTAFIPKAIVRQLRRWYPSHTALLRKNQLL